MAHHINEQNQEDRPNGKACRRHEPQNKGVDTIIPQIQKAAPPTRPAAIIQTNHRKRQGMQNQFRYQIQHNRRSGHTQPQRLKRIGHEK